MTLRELFAPRVLGSPTPRLGDGNLVYPGGAAPDIVDFGPPHICLPPSVEVARSHGADFGAVWRCDCGKSWRLVRTKAGDDAFQDIPAGSPELVLGR